MNKLFGKREFLTGGLLAMGIGAAAAQGAKPKKGVDDLGRSGGEEGPRRKPVPVAKAKTTKMFLSPPGWPNAIAVDPEHGFWVQEQRHDNGQEKAWLLDWKGKLLRTVTTNCKDTSGMAFGNGCIWSGANGASEKVHPTPPINGIFQTDLNSKQISVRQIPFGPKNDGGSCHGMSWQDGKLWLYANRIESIIRIDPKSWEVDYMIPATRIPGWSGRLHGIAYDKGGFIWQVSGIQDPKVQGYEGYTPGLLKYSIETGRVVQIVEFVPGSCDIHDVEFYNGQLYGVDAGEHPGWSIDNPAYQHPGYPPLNSPSGCYIFKIDLV